MKSILTYLKNFIKVLYWPFLLEIGQYLFIILFTIFFNMKYIATLKEQFPTLNNGEINYKFNEILGSSQYIQELNEFLIDNSLIMIIMLTILILPILIKKYNKLKNKEIKKLENKEYLKIMVTSIFLAITLNIIIYLINRIIPFTNRYDDNSIHIYMILSTGILAPILEEYAFRGIIYNELKEFNTKKVSIILTTILFSIFHLGISQIVYAFFIGYYLIYVYDKTNDIKVPVIAHIFVNTSTLLFMPIIVNTNIFLQIGLVILLILGIDYNMKK